MRTLAFIVAVLALWAYGPRLAVAQCEAPKPNASTISVDGKRITSQIDPTGPDRSYAVDFYCSVDPRDLNVVGFGTILQVYNPGPAIASVSSEIFLSSPSLLGTPLAAPTPVGTNAIFVFDLCANVESLYSLPSGTFFSGVVDIRHADVPGDPDLVVDVYNEEYICQ